MFVNFISYFSFFSFSKDQLAADMYSFVSKEGEYARFFVMVSIFSV